MCEANADAHHPDGTFQKPCLSSCRLPLQETARDSRGPFTETYKCELTFTDAKPGLLC